jgi:hypothetical protein
MTRGSAGSVRSRAKALRRSVDEQHVSQVGQPLADRRDLPPVQGLRGHQDLRAAERESLADRFRAEGREERAGDGAVLQRAEDHAVQLGHAAGERDDPVARFHPEPGERIGEPARRLLQIPIGELPSLAAASEPADGGAVTVRALGVAVDALVRDVQPAGRQAIERCPLGRPAERSASGGEVRQVGVDPEQLRLLVDRLGAHSRLLGS